MGYDEYGILLPEVNQRECINCNKCAKVCQINNEAERVEPKHAYAAWSLDEETRVKSASGGIAQVLYQVICEQNGIGYGTFINKNMKVVFGAEKDSSELKKFRGSKYVQAYCGYIFADVRRHLLVKDKVLFIGTPCQIAGLIKYLGRDYDNLILVDLVCHGVASD
jgi:coenzyme F420-reducing hydrogenase beta subunit